MSPAKFYGYLWVVFFVAAGIMWLTGSLSMMAVIVFGLIAFGLVFMGMMGLLPIMVSHPTPKREPAPKKEVIITATSSAPAKAVSGISAYPSV